MPRSFRSAVERRSYVRLERTFEAADLFRERPNGASTPRIATCGSTRETAVP